jgi:hypothetical protein
MNVVAAFTGFITSAAIDVTAPVTGVTPNATATGTGDFSLAAVTWTPDHALFLGGTAYTAEVTLTADAGYVFDATFSATINTFAVNAADIDIASNGSTVTLSYQFAATAAATVSSIVIQTQPTRLNYTEGNALDLTGLEVALTYNDGTTAVVPLAGFGAHGITTSPADGDVLSRATHNGVGVTVSVGGLAASATTNLLTVAPMFLGGNTASIPVLNPMGLVLLVMMLGVAAFRRRVCKR